MEPTHTVCQPMVLNGPPPLFTCRCGRGADNVMRLVRYVTLGISLGWVGALFLDALQPEGARPLTGWELLTTGWRAAEAGIWAWFANPLFGLAVCLLLMRRAQAAGAVAGVALVLALSSLATGALALVFGAGFYLWLVGSGHCSWTRCNRRGPGR